MAMNRQTTIVCLFLAGIFSVRVQGVQEHHCASGRMAIRGTTCLDMSCKPLRPEQTSFGPDMQHCNAKSKTQNEVERQKADDWLRRQE